MKRFLFSAALIVAAAARADVNVKLTFEPATVQAGIPASVVLTVTNDGVGRTTLPSGVALFADAADGTSFVVTDGLHRVRQVPNAPVTLAPHETAVLRWDPDGSVITPWFGERRFAVPGTYRVTAVLAEPLSEETASSGKAALRALPHAIASDAATLVVTPPRSDDDLAVCQRAREWRRGALPGSCPVTALLLNMTLQDFWAQHRASTYALYFAGSYPAPLPDRIAAVESAIARAPGDPIADWRRIHLGQLEQQASGEAFARNDAAGGKAHAARALAAYQAVSSGGRLPAARARAGSLYDDFDDLLGVMNRK